MKTKEEKIGKKLLIVEGVHEARGKEKGVGGNQALVAKSDTRNIRIC